MTITFDVLKSSFVSVEVKNNGVWEKVSRISGEISDDGLIVASKSLPEGCRIVSEQTKDVFVPDVSRPHEAQGFPDGVSLWKFHRKAIGDAGQIVVVPQQEPCSFDRLNQKKLDGIEEGAQVNAVTSVNGQKGDVVIEPVTRVSELMNDAGYISSAPVTSVNGKTGAVVIRKGDVGLDKVENLPLSEFTGSENIRLLGKVERGQWNADPIKKQKIEGASEWDAKLDSIDGLVKAGDGIRIDGAGTPESPLTIVNTRAAGSRAGGAVGSVVKTLNGEKGAVSLIGGTNIDVVKGGNGEITINATGSASGEANTASNLGGGQGLYASKVGVDLRFKSLVAGSNVTLTPSGTEIEISASGGGAVDSVNGQTGAVVLDADDVGAATSAQGALADTALQPSYLSAGTNVTFSGSGTSGSPLVINASGGGGGGAVDSVNGQTGVVVLDADDIDDSSTSHKFVTASDLTKLSNTSGTNTGDQTTSGTANRITVSSGGTNPVIDIASNYAGQNTIVTLGTVTTGVWNGTAIAVANGGTGATTASGARANLGLAIGTDIQAYSSVLAGTTASFTTAQESKLSGIEAGAQVNIVSSVDDTDTVDLTLTSGGLTADVKDASITPDKLAANSVTAAKIANSAVTNAKLANMTAATYKGRNTGTGAPQDLPLVGDMIDGAIIERGSNANGEYVKYADGTMICWSPLITVDVNHARGQVFSSAPTNADFIIWDFPATFAAGTLPHLYGSYHSPSNANGVWLTTGAGSTTQGQLSAFMATSAVNRVIKATAIGKWK